MLTRQFEDALLLLGHFHCKMTSSNGNFFPRYWPFVRGIHRSMVNSPHKGRWPGALIFSLIFGWLNSLINNGEAGDLRRYCGHHDVIVMKKLKIQDVEIWKLELPVVMALRLRFWRSYYRVLLVHYIAFVTDLSMRVCSPATLTFQI